MLEAGTSLTPASWQGKSASNQSRSPLPPHTSVTSDTSDSDADSTFTAPSGRLNPARSNSTPSVSGQARSIFRVSPASNRSPQASFRLKNFSSKGSATLAEDSVSLSNRSDSSSHQDHLADAHPQVLDCRPTSWSVQSACQPVHRSASRTRSPQRVAPAPGACVHHNISATQQICDFESNLHINEEFRWLHLVAYGRKTKLSLNMHRTCLFSAQCSAVPHLSVAVQAMSAWS